MSEQVQLPSVPTEHELAREFPTRPDWISIERQLEGLTGDVLYADVDFGLGILREIQRSDAVVRDYLKVYDRKGGAYWDTPFGAVEKAGEAFAAVRLREEQRSKQFRANALRIMGEYKQADDEAIAAKQKEIEQKQREDAERERQERLDRLQNDLDNHTTGGDKAAIPYILEEIKYVKSELAIPPSVSPIQARAALGAPAMPAGIVSNKRPTYDRLITDKRKFIAWLAAHPAYIDVIAMSFSFTNIKHSPVEIDGVMMSLKTSVQNRAK